MVDHVHTWRKKLRLQELMVITNQELESGKEITVINEILDRQGKIRNFHSFHLSKDIYNHY